MAYLINSKMGFMVFAIMLVSISKPLGVVSSTVPCYFIFGDSLVDPGNNNLLNTTAKANYPPYGVDFPLKTATGRFTNGRTVADIIAEHLGFSEYIPPYVGVKNYITKGVNYASGAAGILDESGMIVGDRFSMNEQLTNHQNIVNRFEVLYGSKNAASEYLNQCIYSVAAGSNDYVNNYFLPQFFSSSRQYNPDQFAALLIQQYYTQLQTLYKYGARKVVLIGLGKLGFTPIEMASHNNTSPPTVSDINNAAELFNGRLKSLVDIMNNNLAGAKFTFMNTTGISSTINPKAQGFTVATSPCCVVGIVGATCIPNSATCPNRNQYVFFDSIHPSEAVNVILGNAYYKATSPTDAYPYDIAHLAQL